MRWVAATTFLSGSAGSLWPAAAAFSVAATEADASMDPGAVFDFSLAREVAGERQPR